jgi:hypothetical protein
MLQAGRPKVKAIPVTGRGDPYGYETSRLPHFLDNRLTEGGEVVSLTLWQPSTPRKNARSNKWTLLFLLIYLFTVYLTKLSVA